MRFQATTTLTRAACETVTAVPVAPAIIDRGIAAPGLLAQVLISKYVDHAPLYRRRRNSFGSESVAD